MSVPRFHDLCLACADKIVIGNFGSSMDAIRCTPAESLRPMLAEAAVAEGISTSNGGAITGTMGRQTAAWAQSN